MQGEINPGYKQTEVGAIPDDWDCVSVAEVAARKANSIVGGPFGSDLVSADYVPFGVPVIRGQNMSGTVVSGDFVYVSDEKSKALKANTAAPGDLVFTQRGTLGQVCSVPAGYHERYVISQSQMKLSPDVDRFESGFLLQYFHSEFGQRKILDSAIQTGVPHTNLGILRSYRLPAPPLSEQRAIAAALSDTDALIAALEGMIAKKRDLKQAAMQQLLTGKTRLPGFSGDWAVKRLGELGYTYGGLTGKSKEDFGHGSAKYITFMNIMTNVLISPNDFEKVDVSANESQNKAVSGDLFFNGSSETPEELGMCSLLNGEFADLYLNSFCFGFRLRDQQAASGLFLAYYFRSSSGRELLSSLAQGATRYNLSKRALMAVQFKFPAPAEQIAIAEVLSDMDSDLAAFETQATKARAVKQGMMQQLLTGQVRLT